MARISIDGGCCFYGPYDIDAVGSDIVRNWDRVYYAMDPYVRERAEQEHGNFGPLGMLEYYLLHAPYDLIVR